MRSTISEGQWSPNPPVPHLAMLHAMLLLEGRGVHTSVKELRGVCTVEGDSCHCGAARLGEQEFVARASVMPSHPRYPLPPSPEQRCTAVVFFPTPVRQGSHVTARLCHRSRPLALPLASLHPFLLLSVLGPADAASCAAPPPACNGACWYRASVHRYPPYLRDRSKPSAVAASPLTLPKPPLRCARVRTRRE